MDLALKAAAGKLGRNWCIDNRVYPISFADGVLTVGHPIESDPEEYEALLRKIRFKALVKKVAVVDAKPEQINALINKVYGEAPPRRSESETIRTWNEIGTAANEMHAANILFEPTPDGGRIRLDIDGDAEEHFVLEEDLYERLVTYVTQGISNFQANIGQRGKTQIDIDGTKINCRISSFPIWNQNRTLRTKLVLRVLKPYELLPSLSELGMEADQIGVFENAMRHPNACVINAAPTGHGKSTTLYSGIINLLDYKHLNIYAIENPPELTLPELSQTEVFDDSFDDNVQWTYHRALVEILRQDPKFVFLGECLDARVARVMIDAGITGIPMATTLHASNAVSIIDRLRTLEIPDRLIAKAITALVAQRLVKKLCDSCRLEEKVSSSLINDAAQFGYIIKPGTPVFRRNEAGCPECFQRGTFGRTAVFEMIEVGSDLRRLIRQNAEDDEITATLRHDGFVSMFERGISLVLRGVIDESELYRRFTRPSTTVGRLMGSHAFNQIFERDITAAESRRPLKAV